MEAKNIIFNQILTNYPEKYIDNKRAIHFNLIQQLILRKETKKNYYEQCISEYIEHLIKYKTEFLNSMPSALKYMHIKDYFEKYKGELSFAIASLKMEENAILNDKSPQDYLNFQESNFISEIAKLEVNHTEYESKVDIQPVEKIFIHFNVIKDDSKGQNLEDLKIEKLNTFSITPLKERSVINSKNLEQKKEINKLQQSGTSKKRKREDEDGYRNQENSNLNFPPHIKDSVLNQPIINKETSSKKIDRNKLDSKINLINSDKKQENNIEDQNSFSNNHLSKFLSPSKRPWVP